MRTGHALGAASFRSSGGSRSLFADLGESLRNPEFWALSSWLDIVVKYRQSRLGLLWLLAPSVIYVFGLGSFFASMWDRGLAMFAAHIAVGWAVFRLVSSVIIEATTVFASSSSFILDGRVRLTDFLLRVIARALFYLAMAMPVVVVALAMYPGPVLAGLLPSLLMLVVLVLNVLWIAVVFGLIGARLPDLSQFIGNVFVFAFLLTPIVWYADTMPPGSLRGTFMRLNPFFHMIELVRAPLLGEMVEPLSLYYLGVMTVVGWSIAAIAYRRYARFVPLWI